jgi:hypothetical protein
MLNIVLNATIMNAIMLNTVKLILIMPNVIMLNAVMVNVVMLNVFMLNVIYLIVVAPFKERILISFHLEVVLGVQSISNLHRFKGSTNTYNQKRYRNVNKADWVK